MDQLNIGDRIKHLTNTAWGIGEVIDNQYSNKITVFFTGVGKKILSTEHAKLQLVADEEAANFILDNLLISNSKLSYRNIDDSIKLFLKKYSKGFNDPKYLKDERNYKYATHIYAKEQLSENNLSKLIKSKDYAAVCSNALKIISYKPHNEHKMNMLFSFGELIPLHQNLKIAENQELFAKNLYDLLHGEDELMERFNRFCDILTILQADKWAVATFFLFIMFPDQYMIIRPTPTIEAATLCAIDIQYNSKTNYVTFDRVIEFANYLNNELTQLSPRDMIDIQSFMWCISQFKNRELN